MRFTYFVLVGVVCIIAAMFLRHEALTIKSRDLSSEPASEGSLAGSFREPTPIGNELHAVIIHKPVGPPYVKLAGADPQQRIGRVACSTCHSVRTANLENRSSVSLNEFHQGLEFNHGQLACYACHNPHNADTLRLADGSRVEYAEVMTLCSQCHSKQAESFAHGAHGGMNGFWDLTRGPQTKNNCIDCHDPHAPTFPRMIVTFKPKDRFNTAEDPHAHHE